MSELLSTYGLQQVSSKWITPKPGETVSKCMLWLQIFKVKKYMEKWICKHSLITCFWSVLVICCDRGSLVNNCKYWHYGVLNSVKGRARVRQTSLLLICNHLVSIQSGNRTDFSTNKNKNTVTAEGVLMSVWPRNSDFFVIRDKTAIGTCAQCGCCGEVKAQCLCLHSAHKCLFSHASYHLHFLSIHFALLATMTSILFDKINFCTT